MTGDETRHDEYDLNRLEHGAEQSIGEWVKSGFTKDRPVPVANRKDRRAANKQRRNTR